MKNKIIYLFSVCILLSSCAILKNIFKKYNEDEKALIEEYKGTKYEASVKEFIKEARAHKKAGGTVVYEDFFLNDFYEDDGAPAFKQGDNFLSQPMILENDSIKIVFGNTKDGVNSNLKISNTLIVGLRLSVFEANKNLLSNEKIKEIYISSTSNGKHSRRSNHYSGNAVDISRINGKMMYLYYPSNTAIKNAVNELQKAIKKYKYVRENFGPAFNGKYRYSTKKWSGASRKTIRQHKDHIHFSVRRF